VLWDGYLPILYSPVDFGLSLWFILTNVQVIMIIIYGSEIHGDKLLYLPWSDTFNNLLRIVIIWVIISINILNLIYSAKNPEMMIIKPDKSITSRKNIKKLGAQNYKFAHKINTNYKFGLSKDFPFSSQYTEVHSLTKTMFPENETPQYLQRMQNVELRSLICRKMNSLTTRTLPEHANH